MSDHASGITALIVSYNSQAVLHRAVGALESGTLRPTSIVIVDNASASTKYLDDLLREHPRVSVLRLPSNTGFCVGNNRGFERVPDDHHLLLVNPDAFVGPMFLEEARAALVQDHSVGAVGPKLLGATAHDGKPTGRIDSAGIFQSRWGRFYDRGQGELDSVQFTERIDVTAICAAAMLIRREALKDIMRTGELFDPRFVMYKEDLDLSFRLRRAGWRTVYDGSMEVLHCRGWNPQRHAMPAWARRRSLINEWRLWRSGWTPERGRTAALPYLIAKSIAVALDR